MGWYISHGGTRHGYSYSGVEELVHRCSGILTRQDWSRLQKTLHPSSGDPFKVKPKQAKEVGGLLLLASGYLPSEWADMARQIGQSALRAAQANETWKWS
ncbi:hypothetical protein [Streptomyces flavochromogenes]|uniref:DUF7739 domain-containing protein n=1 Tax=Streptomyces flavochromogenes TaxID=68199 RepID=UPI00056B2B30|nr:hypothetical protein [Streptomyces flavochromogenes]